MLALLVVCSEDLKLQMAGGGGVENRGQRVFISSFSLVVVVGLLGTERLWGNHKTNPKTQSSEKGSVA